MLLANQTILNVLSLFVFSGLNSKNTFSITKDDKEHMHTHQ